MGRLHRMKSSNCANLISIPFVLDFKLIEQCENDLEGGAMLRNLPCGKEGLLSKGT